MRILFAIALILVAVLAATASAKSNSSQPYRNPCSRMECKFGAICVPRADDRGADCECASYCPTIYQPVCGDDGRVYGNDCLRKLAQCNKQMTIKEVPCESS